MHGPNISINGIITILDKSHYCQFPTPNSYQCNEWAEVLGILDFQMGWGTWAEPLGKE
jgi:hypothetical protein